MEQQLVGGWLRGLAAELSRDLGGAVRRQLELAGSEAADKARLAGKDLGLIAAGGVLGCAGLGAWVAAATDVLAAIMPRWLASLLVGGATLGAGAALAGRGLRNLRRGQAARQASGEPGGAAPRVGRPTRSA